MINLDRTKKPEFTRITIAGVTEDLKPCPNPFCEEDIHYVIRLDNSEYKQVFVTCAKCATTGPKSKLMPLDVGEGEFLDVCYTVITAWNNFTRGKEHIKDVNDFVPQNCPFCDCDDLSYEEMTCGNCKGRAFGLIMCNNCLMACAKHYYEIGDDNGSARIKAQSIMDWNFLKFDVKNGGVKNDG